MKFLIREVQKKDAKSLLALSNNPGMFNLPSTPEGVKERIDLATRSFLGKNEVSSRDKFVFVAEELSTGKVVATSMIAAQHGTSESPHYYFKVSTEKRFSQAIQTGFIHGTLTLHTNSNGPSELGALVVDKHYRGNPDKVGRQIFFSRFLFLHLNKTRFKNELLAELLPPLNKKGNSPLWEAIGRRFTNLDYWEADALAAQNKDFIFDLFPKGKIYTTFLPAEARNAIGKVGKQTEPVFHLLKRIGFTVPNEIDPFDGGPHLRAKVNEIIPLKKTTLLSLDPASSSIKRGVEVSGLITGEPGQARLAKGEFRAVTIAGHIEAGKLFLKKEDSITEVCKLLRVSPQNPKVVFLPYF